MPETRSEVKYLFVKRDAKSKIILGIVFALVLVQIFFFVWTLKLLTSAPSRPQPITPVAAVEKPVIQLKITAREVVPLKKVQQEIPIRSTPTIVRKSILFTFDDPMSHPKFGEGLVLVKKNSGNSSDIIAVHVDETARLGVKGKGLKIEYQFLKTSSLTDWVGVEFKIPAKGSELVFWIRGDAKTGFSPKLKVLISSDGQTRTLPVASLGVFWKRVHFPISGNVDSVKLIIENDPKTPNGAYSLDQFEVK